MTQDPVLKRIPLGKLTQNMICRYFITGLHGQCIHFIRIERLSYQIKGDNVKTLQHGLQSFSGQIYSGQQGFKLLHGLATFNPALLQGTVKVVYGGQQFTQDIFSCVLKHPFLIPLHAFLEIVRISCDAQHLLPCFFKLLQQGFNIRPFFLDNSFIQLLDILRSFLFLFGITSLFIFSHVYSPCFE